VNATSSTFDTDGYEILRGFVDPPALSLAQTEIDRLSTGPVADSYEPQYERDDDPRVRKLRRLYWNQPHQWARVIVATGLDDFVERRLGPDAGLMLHAAFLKPAGVGGDVALHQDQALWDDDHAQAFSVWMA
jgi:hypothetical protein